MPTKEAVLNEQTYKDQGLDMGRRVFYTLTDDERLSAHRTAKYLALLTEKLDAQGVLDGEQIDELLLQAIR